MTNEPDSSASEISLSQVDEPRTDVSLDANAAEELPTSAAAALAANLASHVAAHHGRAERDHEQTVRLLRSRNDRLARALSQSFSDRMLTKVEVRLLAVERVEYRQFVLDLESPTCLAVLRVDPLDVPVAIDWPPELLFAMLASLVGGQPWTAATPQRGLTELEQRLAGHFLRIWCHELRTAWRDVAAMNCVFDRWERYPHRASLAPLREPLTVTRFRVTLGGRDGTITLAIPERALDELSTPSDLPGAATGDRRTGRAADGLGELGVDDDDDGFVVCLAETQVAVADLAGLRVGDVLATDHPLEAPLLVLSGGEPRFAALPGIVRGYRAVRLEALPGPSPATQDFADDAGAAPLDGDTQR